MSEPRRELSADAKLVRVVLENCGPLAPPEAAGEAYLSDERARAAMAELAERGLVEAVCGMCDEREEVYALVDAEEPPAGGSGTAAG